jgi:outer membrane protein insertion porin family
MIMNKITRHLNLICLVMLVLLLIPAQAQEVKKITVLPFEIYSKENKVAIQESLYRKTLTELQKEKQIRVVPADSFLRSQIKLDEGAAINAGRSRQADFVLMGSLTQLGESISVDAKLINVRSGKIASPIFVQGKGLESLDDIAAQLKTDVLVKTGLVEKIAKVEISGNNKIEADAIIQQLKSKEGSPYIESNITEDIKTIFKMGFFLDVSASATDTPEGKIVTFTVVERGLVTDIQIKGNKKLSKSDIMEVLTIKTRENLNREKIKSDILKIKSLYDAEGYYNAEIVDDVEQDRQDYRVILNITENEKIYIKSIAFEGNEAFSTKELKKMMTTEEKGILSFFNDKGILNRDQLKQDVGKINSFYFNNGFINAQVAEPEVTYDKKGLYIKTQIKEGKRYKFGAIVISGDPLQKSYGDLFASLKIREGEYYNRGKIVKDIDFLIQSCNDEGYAYADVNPKIDILDEKQLVNVDYQIIKGELIFINRIAISGNTITRDKVIRRQLSVVEGDLYSSSKLKESYASLNRLRYFEEVDFQTEKGPERDKMNINVRVKEKNTGMFMIGAGYSATEKAVIMAQISQNNFLGYGQQLSLKASLGSQSNNYDLSFTEPWLFDIPLWSKANLWKYTSEYDNYDLDTYGAGFTLGYPLWEKIVGYLGYNFSSNDIKNVDNNASILIKYQEGERTTSAITLTLGRDTRDDLMFPTKGTKSTVSVMYAGLGGDVKLIKYSAGVNAYFPLFWDIVFVTKGRIGYIQNLGSNDSSIPIYESHIPIYERYVLGGINTLRGLRYVGPYNGGTSDVIGGTTMMVFNVELVFPLIKNAGMKGVVFYDAGNAWNNKYYFDDLRQSVGAGIRWYSPIGPLRLEYGYPIDNKGLQSNDGGRWEFTIGMFM